MSYTLKDAKKVANKFKAIVVDSKSFGVHECRIEAPKGFVWAGCGIHELVNCTNIPWKPDYNDLIERMSYGIEKCEDKYCDWCNGDTNV